LNLGTSNEGAGLTEGRNDLSVQIGKFRGEYYVLIVICLFLYLNFVSNSWFFIFFLFRLLLPSRKDWIQMLLCEVFYYVPGMKEILFCFMDEIEI